ncbi:fumarylacetoacetate hydrolase family protein [Agrobacterium leguminum]|uniref:Fumarylacetoacetate hydrolase family protein n=1 Tax=Agrobacterium deltaense NCPPB 1641 TaxID=1183425 RepID=A0A1S7U6P1_9HYPH|nr:MULTISPECIES: fumarylacetoacetate hydrolase family protein [Agrobacterium]WFS68689.1 fumarylacetoacetate hydrolase family protein [Agrobacterium leguminum]CVI62469.1 putative Fumarylacetoacetate hydrolase family protein [Agrobacterium deltaense NCPPB 1641]
MSFIFTPPATPSVAIEGNGVRFPVRRIFCVGRNYADHAREMGKDPDREPPFFFTKPADAVCDSGSRIPYPPLTSNLHHEVELVVAIGSEARNIPVEEALSCIWGYGVGIDLTRRDLQLQARDLGRPWDWGKAFDMSAPCGPLRKADFGYLQSAQIRLEVNGSTRQEASLNELIWSVPEIVSLCSASVVLQPGDLIFTGTPAGVSAITKGDRLVGSIDGLPDVTIDIA